MRSPVRVVSGLAMVLSLINACSGTPPRQTAEAPAPVLAPAIEGRILPPFQDMVVFDVNQPAYVAVFDVRPFIGIEMIYPGPNDPGRATGGVQAAPIYHLVQATEERQAQATPFIGGGEDYLYFLASRTPLHLEPFADHPIMLSDSAGVSLGGLPPYEQIDSLMRNVVQPTYDRDWDADVLILTPGQDGSSVSASGLALNCGIEGAPDAKICAHTSHVVEMDGIPSGGVGGPRTTATEQWRLASEQAATDAIGDMKSGKTSVATTHTEITLKTMTAKASSTNTKMAAKSGGGSGKP